jgi:hypothetical protein
MMELSQAPGFVAAKVAMLADGCAAAATRADELVGRICHVRDLLNGRIVRQGDHPAELGIELDRLLAEQTTLQRQRPIEADIMGKCRTWLAALPPETPLKQIIPGGDDGLSLSDVRARTKKLQNHVEALKRVPVAATDIEQRVRTFVERLPMPVIDGIGADEALRVVWPTGLHALMAFLQPDVLVDRLMLAINQIANTPYPPAEREQRIAQLEQEVDRLQRIEEAIVVATGAPREQGCLPWVVLGVKAIEAPGVRAA